MLKATKHPFADTQGPSLADGGRGDLPDQSTKWDWGSENVGMKAICYYIYERIDTYILICVCIYVCMYVYIAVCIIFSCIVFVFLCECVIY